MVDVRPPKCNLIFRATNFDLSPGMERVRARMISKDCARQRNAASDGDGIRGYINFPVYLDSQVTTRFVRLAK